MLLLFLLQCCNNTYIIKNIIIAEFWFNVNKTEFILKHVGNYKKKHANINTINWIAMWKEIQLKWYAFSVTVPRPFLSRSNNIKPELNSHIVTITQRTCAHLFGCLLIASWISCVFFSGKYSIRDAPSSSCLLYTSRCV